MSRADFSGAKEYALKRLAEELSPKLTYHTLAHTRDDVFPAAERLASLENISTEDRLLLLTATYYHDIGYVETVLGHEEVGVQIAEEVLPGFGYQPDQIEVIKDLILATKIPHAPVNHLQKIINDADLDNLGREDFFALSLKLQAELAALGNHTSDRAWYQSQLEFLESHQYFTESAIKLRQEKKQENITLLKELLAKI